MLNNFAPISSLVQEFLHHCDIHGTQFEDVKRAGLQRKHICNL